MGNLDQQSGAQQYIGGGGETLLEKRQRLLRDREGALKKALEKLKRKRSLLRQGRQKKHLPHVAVVGYTNAGITCGRVGWAPHQINIKPNFCPPGAPPTTTTPYQVTITNQQMHSLDQCCVTRVGTRTWVRTRVHFTRTRTRVQFFSLWLGLGLRNRDSWLGLESRPSPSSSSRAVLRCLLWHLIHFVICFHVLEDKQCWIYVDY